ncbi:MAG: hypothetical protein JJU29_04375 [Verrucomicrobia bacterium]|nr:hypothetical protein [Verrucomicrobiota bacterium]MCH8512071.1 hypothetical protein [Kiritimatiellia bacterium]
MTEPIHAPPRLPALPLALAVSSLLLAAAFITICLQGRYSFFILMATATPALFAATGALTLGVYTVRKRPPGAPYGFAMGGTLLGGFALVFWFAMLPLIFMVMLPAMDAEPADANLATSEKRMRILIRQTKAFHMQTGRLPLRLEELVQAGFTPAANLYDPRTTLRDQPSYRLILDEMPPESEWANTPALEGRIPDENGYRLLGYLNERIGRTR